MTDKLGPPKLDNAPGIVWKKRLKGWEARWQARTDIAKRGYRPASLRLWSGAEMSELEAAWVRGRCQALQDDMLEYGRGGAPVLSDFTCNIRSLIACYEKDPDSPFHKIEYKTRENYGSLLRRLLRDMGELPLESIKARDLLRFHESWIKPDEEGGRVKIAMGHSLVGMFRTLVNFGATILEDEECERLSSVLHKMKFKMGKPRDKAIEYEQVLAVIAMAHTMGLHSIAVAQAAQWDFIIRQKDAIGEWVPMSEPGMSDTISGNEKWRKGLRWEEIDAGLRLHHITSKRKKLIEPSLYDAPLFMGELRRMVGAPDGASLTRDMLPASGPVVVSDLTMIPWTGTEYRRQWRIAARACGIPDDVRNMDSRAGAITEALLAGAPLDSVRKNATHSNSSQTQQYSRGDAKASSEVAQFRLASRNKNGTSGGEQSGNGG